MNFARSLFQKYTQRLQKKPYSTKMATSCFIFTISDYVCQTYIEKKTSADYNYVRTFRQAMFGTLFVSPSLHVWHSHFIPAVTRPLKTRFATVATSVALGETLLSSYFLSSVLFFYDFMASHSFESGKRNVQEKFWPTFLRSFQYWSGVSLMTYSIIPIHFRPVFSNCFSFAWQIYMSYIANLKQDSNEIIPNISASDIQIA